MTASQASTSKQYGIAVAAALAALFMAGASAQAHGPVKVLTKTKAVCSWKGCVKVQPHRHVKKRRTRQQTLLRKLAQKRTFYRNYHKRKPRRALHRNYRKFKALR